MDKIPKFRRKQKPKPPAIQTTLVDRRSSTDSAASSNGGGVALAAPEQQPARHRQPNNLSPSSTVSSSSSLKPPRKSTFRSLSRLRSSAKRGRGSPPAELPLSPLPPAAVVGVDGVAAHSPPRSAGADDERESVRSSGKPRIPVFLTLSAQAIDKKFGEIVWAERHRIAEAVQNHAVRDFKWGVYMQQDPHNDGVMDRYINIKPWNHNRVKLRVPANELDYVNASSITLPSPSDSSRPPLRYIAMQGPTEPSFSYVWRMIAEQTASPSVIVQLTTMLEGTQHARQVKCHQYFPTDDEDATWTLNESDTWGDGWTAQLTYDSLEELADGAIEKRKLLLHVEGEDEARVVWHFLYRRWPDFGVPTFEDLDSFYELMRLSREHSNPANPRVIHCSAGVGRTGTFICLEHLIRELDAGALEAYDSPTEEKSDLVYDTVDALRQQRRSMVQADVQYQFIYQVMRRLWQDKYGAADDSEPVAKRLEVEDSDLDGDAGDGPDVGEGGVNVGVDSETK